MASKVSQPTAPIFLICGDDEFAVKQRARLLFQQMSAEIGGFDHDTIDAAVSNSGEALAKIAKLREAMQTLPFFGTGKVIWFKNCNFLGEERTASSQSVTETLAELAQELKAFDWSQVRLIISSGKVDKRKTFYKTLDKLGTVEVFAGWSADNREWAAEAENAARRQLRDLKKEISEEALSKLVAGVGPNNRLLAGEVEKLALYCGERDRVETKDVDTIVSRNKQSKAFALGDALGARDLPRLLKTLDEELWELRTEGSKSEIGILYGLITKVRLMIFLKEMIREGWIKPESDYGRFKSQLEAVPPESLPEDRKFNPLAMHPFQLYNSLPHARKYSLEELIRAMEILLECNQRLIFSGLDEALVLQQSLLKIVQPAEGRAEAAAGRPA